MNYICQLILCHGNMVWTLTFYFVVSRHHVGSRS